MHEWIGRYPFLCTEHILILDVRTFKCKVPLLSRMQEHVWDVRWMILEIYSIVLLPVLWIRICPDPRVSVRPGSRSGPKNRLRMAWNGEKSFFLPLGNRKYNTYTEAHLSITLNQVGIHFTCSIMVLCTYSCHTLYAGKVESCLESSETRGKNLNRKSFFPLPPRSGSGTGCRFLLESGFGSILKWWGSETVLTIYMCSYFSDLKYCTLQWEQCCI